MLPIELLIVLIAALGNILIGLFTFYKNTNSATNRLFFLFSIVIGIYLCSNYLLSHQPTDEETFFWVKIVIAVAGCLNVLFFLLAVSFPRKNLQISTHVLVLLVLSVSINGILSFSGFIFTDAKTIQSGAGTPGIGMPYFLLHTLLLLGGGIIALVRKYRKSIKVEKNQIRLVLFGTAVMFVAILITNVVFVVFLKNASFVGLLPLYTLIFAFSISYAIVRHKLLDIGWLVGRTVVYSLLIFFAGGIYSLLFFFVGSTLFSIPFTLNQLIFYALFAFLITVTFQHLKRIIEKVTDTFLFQNAYDSEKLLKLFSHIMSVTLELNELTEKVLDEVLQNMKVTKAVFLLLSSKHETIDFIVHKGYDTIPHFTLDDVTSFLKAENVIVFDDLEEGELKNRLRTKGISVVLQLGVSGNKIGVLCLGEKATGEIYSQKDISIFEILAPELSVAIRNSQAYEEIKRFNITLQQEVNNATKELKDANEKLKALDKLKDEFVSLASHELRTPMTAIKSYLWMALAGKGGDLSEKQKYYLDRAYTSTDRLIKLVNEMLNVSRIESGRIILDKKEIDINKLTDDVIADVLPRAQELGISLQTDHLDLPHVLVDEDKIKEVFINLIGNSLKFTPKDGKITIAFSKNDGNVEISVTDTGKGIAAEDISKLFQKFGKVDNDYLTAQNVQGTGLGLYISKAIVSLHGGAMRVRSDGIGKGTTFTFSLPFSTQHAANDRA